MSDRDYSKFIKEGNRLNVRLLPRVVYVEMVTRHRQKDGVIHAVFEDQYWLWDLEQRERMAAEEGRSVTRAELANEILDEMSDNDWWKTIAAFEEHLITDFPNDPSEWSEFLDPVYDMQEREGWRNRQ